jgi:Tol biopolymer transport system component
VLISGALAAAACSEPSGPSSGVVRVTAAVSGPGVEPDGFTVAVDGGSTQPLEPGATAELSLRPGEHTITLGQVPPHCTITDGPARTVLVEAGEPAEVTFEVACSATSGLVDLVAATSGQDLDPSGYRITVDGGNEVPLDANGSTTIAVGSGSHAITLGGVAANCELQGDAMREVVVTAAARVQVVFPVVCVAAAPAGRGEEIAFVREESSDPFGAATLRIMNSDGTGARDLLGQTLPGVGSPAWRPDGSGLVFPGTDPDLFEPGYFEVGADGSAFRPWAPCPFACGPPAAWSPDGSRLGWVTSFQTNDLEPATPDTAVSQLVLLSADGLERETLVFLTEILVPFEADRSLSTLEDRLTWSSDGSRMTFVLGRFIESPVDLGHPGDPPFAIDSDIYTLDTDGSNLRPITDSPEAELQPAWSPDGSRIAFALSSSPYSPDPFWNPLSRLDIYVMRADGTERTRLTTGGGNFWPAWAPDGTRIAFVSTRDGNSEIYVMQADGSNQTRITNHPAADVRPVWRP